MSVNFSMFAGAGAQFFDENGAPLSGGLIYTYQAGTTTPTAVYTSNLGSTAHTNPIVLDSAGRVPNGGEIWLTNLVDYKFIVKTSTGVTQGTYDNVPGNGSGIYESVFTRLAQADGSSLIGFTPAATTGVTTTVQAKLRQTISVRDFGATGDGTTDDTGAIQAAILSLPSTGGTLIFPNGEYKVTSGFTVSKNNVWLCGELNARIKRYGAFEIFNVTGSYNKISDLQLMGNKVSYPYPAYARAAIVIIQGDFNIVSDCQIEDGNSHGILFRTGGAPQFNLVQGNIVLNCEEVGIAHDGGVDNRILGNHVSGCGFEGITLDQSSYRCVVDGNRINANCQTGGVGSIGVDWTDLCVISNNIITASGTLSGITFQNNLGPSNRNVISGNVFVDNPGYGVWLKNNTGGTCNDNVITGNMFGASGSIKIDSACQRNILSGNSYITFPDVDASSYCRVDNALVNFYVQNTVTRSNVTGDGTAYTIPYDTIIQDRNIASTSSFNTTTGVFTAPITANYTFSAGALLTSGTGTADSLVVELVTSAGTFTQTFSSTNQAAFGASITASFFLKRNETAFVRVTVSGGSKDYSVTNNVNSNFFTGVLVG